MICTTCTAVMFILTRAKILAFGPSLIFWATFVRPVMFYIGLYDAAAPVLLKIIYYLKEVLTTWWGTPCMCHSLFCRVTPGFAQYTAIYVYFTQIKQCKENLPFWEGKLKLHCTWRIQTCIVSVSTI